MVLMKKVNNANAGDPDHVGGNDWDKVADYYNDIDVGEVPRINTPTEYRSGILKIRDGSNVFNVAIKSATQTANRDFTIPALIGNDSPATLALANNFTALQTVQLDADSLLSLYRPVSTTNALCGLGFYERNSSNASVQYAAIYNKLVSNTAGDEDGKLVFYVRKDGVLTEAGSIDKNGTLNVVGSFAPASITTGAITGTTLIGTSLALGTAKVGGILVNDGTAVTTASTSTEFDMLNYSVPGNLLGVNGALRVRISGYLLQNQATSTTFTFKIIFGGTTIYADATSAIAQFTPNLPFIFEFEIGNKNATNSQGCSGKVIIQDGGGATTGEGDISDDELSVNANFRSATGASTQDTTTAKTLQVTMTHSVNNANVATSVQRKIIEFLPGT